ncbi:hypothetical protein EV291_105114 [Rhizobium sp. BK068]|nr:hypothetical protein EV291_105114 [Rhizobium sp. BK068]
MIASGHRTGGFVGEATERDRSFQKLVLGFRAIRRPPIRTVAGDLFGHVPHASNAIAVGFTGFLILDIGVKRLTLIGPHLFAIRSLD